MCITLRKEILTSKTTVFKYSFLPSSLPHSFPPSLPPSLLPSLPSFLSSLPSFSLSYSHSCIPFVHSLFHTHTCVCHKCILENLMIWFKSTSVLFLSHQTTNPSTVKPCYMFWAPWIGHHSRKGNMVFNTEHRKCKPIYNRKQAESEINDGDTVVGNTVTIEILLIR